MALKRWHLVIYDVRDPRRLRRTAKHLEGYGSRVQYSVFRCKLSPREMERMRWELQKILDGEDDLLIIGLCTNCVAALHSTGEDDWTAREKMFEIV